MKDLDHILKNSRISLEPQEREKMEKYLDEVLTWFEKIQEIEVSNEKPAFHPIEIKNVWREDKVEVFEERDEMLKLGDLNPEGFVWGPRTKPTQK